MRNICTGVLLCIVTLVGCSIEQTLEEYFHQKMKQMHKDEKNFSYSLVHTELNAVHENDGIVVFEEHNNHQGDQIYIAYLEKEEQQWEWKRTRGAKWNSPVKWSSMNQPPYIYSGAISDNSITKVYAGNQSAKIIQVEEDKRFWYAISSIKDVKVKMVKEDGSEEFMEEINYEELENQ